MYRILIIEDEPNMLMGLRDNLEFEGYQVFSASTGPEGLTQAQTLQGLHLILLDIMLPGMSGYEVCKRLRKAGIETPVIFLSAKGEEIDKVLGLELGADDYITKPFGLRELLARIKAVLRRGNGTSMASSDSIQIGQLRVNFHQYEAFIGQDSVNLSHKEFQILQYMWEHRNTVVERQVLLEKVWGYTHQPTTRTVDNFVLKLRQKIELNPNKPRIILTVHGMGYKLVQ